MIDDYPDHVCWPWRGVLSRLGLGWSLTTPGFALFVYPPTTIQIYDRKRVFDDYGRWRAGILFPDGRMEYGSGRSLRRAICECERRLGTSDE